MTKLSILDLTDAQKEQFTDLFYTLVSFDDTESPAPWGCPWIWDAGDNFTASTIEELVQMHYDRYKADFAEYE